MRKSTAVIDNLPERTELLGIRFWWKSLKASFIALALHEAATAIHLEKDSTV